MIKVGDKVQITNKNYSWAYGQVAIVREYLGSAAFVLNIDGDNWTFFEHEIKLFKSIFQIIKERYLK